MEQGGANRATIGQSVRIESLCGRDDRGPSDVRGHASRHTSGQQMTLPLSGGPGGASWGLSITAA